MISKSNVCGAGIAVAIKVRTLAFDLPPFLRGVGGILTTGRVLTIVSMAISHLFMDGQDAHPTSGIIDFWDSLTLD